MYLYTYLVLVGIKLMRQVAYLNMITFQAETLKTTSLLPNSPSFSGLKTNKLTLSIYFDFYY